MEPQIPHATRGDSGHIYVSGLLQGRLVVTMSLLMNETYTTQTALPDPATAPELFEGVLTRRVAAYVIDLFIMGAIVLGISFVGLIAGLLTFGLAWAAMIFVVPAFDRALLCGDAGLAPAGNGRHADDGYRADADARAAARWVDGDHPCGGILDHRLDFLADLAAVRADHAAPADDPRPDRGHADGAPFADGAALAGAITAGPAAHIEALRGVRHRTTLSGCHHRAFYDGPDPGNDPALSDRCHAVPLSAGQAGTKAVHASDRAARVEPASSAQRERFPAQPEPDLSAGLRRLQCLPVGADRGQGLRAVWPLPTRSGQEQRSFGRCAAANGDQRTIRSVQALPGSAPCRRRHEPDEFSRL